MPGGRVVTRLPKKEGLVGQSDMTSPSDASAVDISESAASSLPASTAAASSTEAAPKNTLASRPLGVLFRLAQASYTAVDDSSLPGNDEGLQKRVLEGLGQCEAALLNVERQAIFSPNELGEDINTGDLKYLLLPFYRGELLLRVVDQPKRLPALREALKSLRGFVNDQERLELLAPEASGWQQTMGSGARADPAAVRTQKIARLKASKAAKQKLEAVRGRVQSHAAAPLGLLRGCLRGCVCCVAADALV